MHKINQETYLHCKNELAENPVKASFRILISKYLKWKYGLRTLGCGLRWGKHWDIKRNILSVGDFSYIGPRVQIMYPTTIGDLVLVAADVQFLGNDHEIENVGIPIRISQVEPKQETFVDSEAWIGQRSIIFQGLTIGRGAVIASGSVVTKDVAPYTVVGGVPAAVIRKRFSSEEDEQKHDQSLYSP